jgi:hypothetical protein
MAVNEKYVWIICVIILAGKTKVLRKIFVPVPLCPPQIPQILA